MKKQNKIIYLEKNQRIEIRHVDDINDKKLSIREASKILGIARNTLYSKIRKGEILTDNSGLKPKITISEINKFNKDLKI
jgi:excisionase family DNA binding protein